MEGSSKHTHTRIVECMCVCVSVIELVMLNLRPQLKAPHTHLHKHADRECGTLERLWCDLKRPTTVWQPLCDFGFLCCSSHNNSNYSGHCWLTVNILWSLSLSIYVYLFLSPFIPSCHCNFPLLIGQIALALCNFSL